jgi:hypothetical protein
MTVSYSSLLGGNPIIGTIPVVSGGTGTASLTGILKGNGTSAFTTAASGTDYIAPSGALGTPTSGVLTNCTGYTYTNLSGTVPTWNQNTTGTAAGLSTTLSIASGGTGASTLAGANIPVTTGNNTFTGTQTFSGTSSALSSVFSNLTEVTTVTTLPSATLSFYVATQSVMLFTSNSANNWTLNITYSAGTSLNAVLAVGQSVTIAFMVTNGSTAYYNSATQVDGVAVTPKWQGGTAPTAGNASSLDVYSFTVTKTASATFTVLASLTKFA